ncbi:hypothetical protein [uncultured Dysgonomonas sp.]|uniref:Uncharacterized protein n=1 Tax=uncultured Dysgonomonas sp. TaxID=206096 RepID=A0A212IXG0_9BACT|nr:hypothetical protein [uncultured Dysgonomonas sp.]SBV91911.1 hypothetical protein KL86DYS1_10465 [uncultured Dysgonomonas sp.]
MTLSENEKQELRLWCMTHNHHEMYETYKWLINSKSIEELELKKKVYMLCSRNFQSGTFQEQYHWIITGIMPQISVETFTQLCE